jgi:hypothetical protein
MSRMAYGPGNIPCAGGLGELQHAHNANGQIWKTVCGNIAHGFPLGTVAKFKHGFQPVVVCFNFPTLNLCQPFPFSCCIADALATLIACVFPRLPPHIPIMALAFHVCASDDGPSLASRLKSGPTVLTLIMKLMIRCCRLIMHYKILRLITRRD